MSGPRISAAAVVGLLVCLAAGPAGADDPTPGWDPSTRTHVASDGIVTVLVQPEFRAATLLKEELDRFPIAGLETHLATPRVASTPIQGKPTPPAVFSRLLLRGSAAAVARGRAWIERLDVAAGAVAVSVLVSEVRQTCNSSRGAKVLFDKDNVADPRGSIYRGALIDFEPEAYLASTLTGARPFEGTSLFLGDTTSNGAFSATLRMLSKRGEAEFLAWPNVHCTEGGPAAQIHSIDEVPRILVNRAGASPTVEVRGVATGLRLEVAPIRVGEDEALLDLRLWLRVAEAGEGPTTPIASTVLRTRELTTRVTVRDREPLMIGGLYLRRRMNSRRGLPVLQGISVVEAFTSSGEGAFIDTELVFLVRARIVTPGRHAVTVPAAGTASTASPEPAFVPSAQRPNPQLGPVPTGPLPPMFSDR